jgi:predicted TIM-barrel fold metal-dependent hydrolase
VLEKKDNHELSRRSVLKKGSLAGAIGVGAGLGAACASGKNRSASDEVLKTISDRVFETPIVDTHEHLIEEEGRLSGTHDRIKANDWSFLLSHYLNSDLISSGMPFDQVDSFFSAELDPQEKWKMIEPYWPHVRLTGYGQAVSIAVEQIYGVSDISAETITKVQEGYEKTIRPGFYRHILQDLGNIESCQVNSLERPFQDSKQPTLLMQDISLLGMHMGPRINAYAPAAGIEVSDLQDWHSVIDWWFERYGQYAVAVKSQAAYSRNIDFEDVPAEKVEKIFKRKLNNSPINNYEEKNLQDHLFWYGVRKATENNLPVKIHTGYYAGHNRMPLGRLQQNAAAACDLCRMSRDTKWVFMHINYPSYEDLIAVSKHYTNCYIDMCWAWIISPVASVNFLRQYLVTAPSNKILTFGGDYIPVEPVLGHVDLARRGIAASLAGLVDDGWIGLGAALDSVEPLLRGNARQIFDLEKKTRLLRKAPWL